MFGDISWLTSIAIIIVTLLLSVAVHEAMHAYVGLRLGDDTAAEEGRISLNPLRHIDPFMTVILPALTLAIFHVPILAAKPVPFNPDRVRFEEYGAALIAFAGPASNFILACLAAVVVHFVPMSGLAAECVSTFLMLNISLFVFNLVPIPPLDGSRILYAFAPDAVRRVFEQIEPYGFVIVFGLVLAGGLGSILTNINQAVLRFLV